MRNRRLRARLFLAILVLVWPAAFAQQKSNPEATANEKKLSHEIAKLEQEVDALRYGNQRSLRDLQWWAALLGAIGGFATAMITVLGFWFVNSVQTKYTKTQDRKLDQDRELQRESHNIELFKNLANENPRLQLAAAAVLLQRLEIYKTRTQKLSAAEELERSAIIQVLLSVLKEKHTAGQRSPLSKLIADNLVQALGVVMAANTRPDSDQSKLASWDFQKANLVNCWWKRVDARGVDFFGADISNSGLAEAFLSRATFYEASLEKTVLTNAELDGADLRQANLRGTNMTGANLSGARLGGACYTAATRWPDGFDPGAAGARRMDDESTSPTRSSWGDGNSSLLLL